MVTWPAYRLSNIIDELMGDAVIIWEYAELPPSDEKFEVF